jgi:hypothetical protein
MEKGKMIKIKIVKMLAIVSSLLMVLMMIIPTFAVNGPLTQNLQYRFYTDQGALFTGLLSGDIDFMAWPLTYAQYQTAITTVNITVAPYFDLGDYEIAFNNNATDPSHTGDRKAMNYTEFRQAISCLIDKDGLIAGANVNGFGFRIDTQVPRPMLNDWVNFQDSKYDANGNVINKYPWEFNETHAAEILWNDNWLSHATYPSVAAVMAALPLPAGSVHYPPSHPRAETAIDSIIAYIRTDHLPRKEAGESLVAEMTKFGIGTTVTEGPSSVCYTPVFINHDFDFYTAGWSLSAHPLQFYSECTPIGIYPGGPNLYMIDDANLTNHATLEYPQSISTAQSISEAKICQDIIVQQAMFVPLYSSTSYMAYKTGAVGVINFRGYGLTTALEYTFLNCKTAPYSVPMTIKYGTFNPPEQINPIFSSWVWDYEGADRIFNEPMATNPYNPTVAGKSPGGADLPWMAYDWNYQQSNFSGGGGLGNPSDSYTNMANVTYWFRHDITWQDGVPFTVDDFNYTIYLNKVYGDSWGYSDMVHVVNFVKVDDWTCSVYFDIPTFWALYAPRHDIVPMHIYKYIAVPADAQTGASTTGLHGYWPGANALPSEILPGAPFTFSQLTSGGGEQYTWVGTGMWKYVSGTLVQGTGGGLSLVPYSGFWMNITQGDIDFRYSWNIGPAPQDGSYKVGIWDLMQLANADGTSGNGHPIPFKLGGPGVWEPGCDISPPAGTVGLSDIVAQALNYGKHWGSAFGGGGEGSGGGEFGIGGSDALVSVVPNLVEPKWVGQNFTVAIVVQNVTPTNVPAGLGGVEIHFAWNATLIQPLSFVNKINASDGVLNGTNILGPSPRFYDDAGNQITTPPYSGATNYRVASGTPGKGWWGNGTVATITFQVIYQPSTPPPASSCTLDLRYVELVTPNVDEIGFQRENGQYTILPPPHEVIVTDVSPSKTVVGQGYSTFINVTVENQGGYTEDFNVTAYTNTTDIGNQTVNSLLKGTSTVLAFEWNTTGFVYGDYTLEAVASTVPNETNTANNDFVDGKVVVTIPGDLNGDFKVSLQDLVLLANAYGSKPGDPNWNPNADINGDGKVSLQDLVIMANHYGQHHP